VTLKVAHFRGRFPDEMRPTWMPPHLWENLVVRASEGENLAEFVDSRNGRVYAHVAENELREVPDLWALVGKRLRIGYFTVHHPERLYC
jgi:hypothetical protein